jgi:hypothetical protein
MGIGAHARVLPVKNECDTRFLLRSGVDVFEARVNFFEGKRLVESEVKIFRESVVGKIAALKCRASTGRRSDSASAFENQARQ